jgi:MFS family permease
MSDLALRRRALRQTYFDAFFTAVMIGTAESFAIFFGVEHGLTLSQLALVSTLPILVGAIAQWLVPLFVPQNRLRQTILVSVAVQILGLVGLFFSVFTGRIFEGLLAALSLYWIGGMIGGPLWLDWVAGWMPHKSFSRFLSRRNAFASFSTLAAYLVTALIVNAHPSAHAFEVVFLVAALARVASWITLFKQVEPSSHARSVATDIKAPEHWSSKPVLVILVTTVLFKFAANVSSPFFTPYMLNELHFDLLHYVGITAIPFVGRFLFLSRWGEAAKDIRPFIGLQISMLLISVSPVLWTFTKNYQCLFGFEFVSGLMWGGFDLCSVLIVQNFWPGSARRFLGAQLALMSVAALAGAWMGSWLVEHKGVGYHDIFVLSSDLRVITTLIFALCVFWLKDMRSSLKVYGDFLATVLTLRPSFANIGRVIPLRRGRRSRRAFS